MLPTISLLPFALSDLYAQSTRSGKITIADRYGLLAALLNDSITQEEKYVIDRIIWGVHRGKVQIVEELSTVLV